MAVVTGVTILTWSIHIKVIVITHIKVIVIILSNTSTHNSMVVMTVDRGESPAIRMTINALEG